MAMPLPLGVVVKNMTDVMAYQSVRAPEKVTRYRVHIYGAIHFLAEKFGQESTCRYHTVESELMNVEGNTAKKRSTIVKKIPRRTDTSPVTASRKSCLELIQAHQVWAVAHTEYSISSGPAAQSFLITKRSAHLYFLVN